MAHMGVGRALGWCRHYPQGGQRGRGRQAGDRRAPRSSLTRVTRRRRQGPGLTHLEQQHLHQPINKGKRQRQQHLADAAVAAAPVEKLDLHRGPDQGPPEQQRQHKQYRHPAEILRRRHRFSRQTPCDGLKCTKRLENDTGEQ